jgi:hypothetical protein
MGMSKQTACITCGTAMTYKTKKPKYCRKHKPNKQYRRKKTSSVSKGELKMKQLLVTIFPQAVYIDNGYYSFLPSPKGATLQLDRYYPNLRLAFEYDGPQHEKQVAYFQTKEAFQYLQKCDRLKDYYCEAEGIRLIRVPHNVKLTQGELIELLKKEGILEYLKTKTHVCDNYSY